MSKVLAIIGAGHLGQQIAHFAIADGHYSDIVFFDDFSKDRMAGGYTIKGSTAEILKEYKNNSFDELLIGIGYNHLEARKRMYDKFVGLIPFGKIIHSTCWIDDSAVISNGTVLYPGCIVDAHTELGPNTIVNLGCTIAHDCKIGPHSFFAPRVAVAGFVSTGEMCFFGINSTVVDNLTIVAQTRTGAGTVITKSIAAAGLYLGVPHKKISE